MSDWEDEDGLDDEELRLDDDDQEDEDEDEDVEFEDAADDDEL